MKSETHYRTAQTISSGTENNSNNTVSALANIPSTSKLTESKVTQIFFQSK
jgi:hypothetical protein